MKILVLHFTAGTPYIEALSVFRKQKRKKLLGVRKFISIVSTKIDTFFDKSIKGGGFM